MSHPDEGLIHAWLDGELEADEAARVERLVATDAAWAAAAAEARGLVAASSRIVRALDAVPGGVVPKGTSAGGTAHANGAPRRGFRLRPWMAAASVVMAAGIGYGAWISGETVGKPLEMGGAAEPSTPTPSVAASGAAEREVASTDAMAGAAAEPAPPTVSEVAPQRAKQREAARTRQAPLSAAPTAAAAAGLAITADKTAPAPSMLDGCWTVTAPDSLAATYTNTLRVAEERGDTLTVLVPRAPQPARVRVLRNENALRGDLTAQRVPCPE